MYAAYHLRADELNDEIVILPLVRQSCKANFAAATLALPELVCA
jgi:hypothetical protein